MKTLNAKTSSHRPLTTLIISLLSTLSVLAQDSNVLIGLNAPANGVRIKTNFPGYTGGWARGFNIANRNNTENHIQFGALGSATSGVDQLSYGFIGKNYSDTYMVFRPSGKVGIGTAIPTEKLHVTGNLYTTGSIKSASRTYYFGNVQQLYGGNGAVLYYKSNSSNSTQLIMRDKENVNYGVLCGNGNGTNFGLLDGDGNWSYLAAKDNYTALKINSIDIMRLKADGKVGIGTTAPTKKLHVEGESFINGNLYLTNPNASSGNGGKLILASGTEAGSTHSIGIKNYWTEFRSHANEGWKFITSTASNNDVVKMIIEGGSGKVSIGNVSTSANNYKLFVEKGILTEKVRVAVKSTSDWSDYVFEEDYEVMPITELEDYIAENKHLPNVPSAEEMVKGGLDVATMDAKLLEKIEEAYLYIIQLENRIKTLEENGK